MIANPPVADLKNNRAETLGAEITQLHGMITAATFDLLSKIAEFDRDGLWQGLGLCSCAHWLNWQCGIGMNAAREKVRVARALAELPKVSEAFRSGEVSYSKVRAITRVAKPESEEYLLMIARHGTAHHVESLVRGFRRAKKLNDPEIAEEQVRRRCFDYHWDDDGSLMFRGRLPAEVGAMLMKALKKAVDRADAESDVTAETRDPVAARRADAVAGLAESYLANGPGESSSAERYQVMVHVTAETSGIGAGTIEDGPGVTAETSKRLCCDASISKLLENEKGEPTSIGRRSRVIPPPMRRALQARDKQCRFPGCTHSHFIDGHHVHHWSDGGETGLDNLVLLCRHHHRLVHEGGFICEKDCSGQVVFRDRDGHRIEASGSPHSRFRGNFMAELNNQLEDRHIHAQTVVPNWHGERMDFDLAVGLLVNLDGAVSEHANDCFRS
jgi:hypothetical protein